MLASFLAWGFCALAGASAIGIICSKCVPWVVYLSPADNCLAPKTGYNAPLSSHGEGAFCYDSTSILLSARGLRTPVAVCHAAPRLAQPRRDDPDKASQAPHAAPPA